MSGSRGSTRNMPEGRNTTSATRVWMCGLKVTRSPKVYTYRTKAGRPRGSMALKPAVSSRATIAKGRPDQLRLRERVLAMRHRGEHVMVQPRTGKTPRWPMSGVSMISSNGWTMSMFSTRFRTSHHWS